MAYPLPLSGANKRSYLDALRDSHVVSTSLVLLDRDEDPKGERLSDVIDGWGESGGDSPPVPAPRRYPA